MIDYYAHGLYLKSQQRAFYYINRYHITVETWMCKRKACETNHIYVPGKIANLRNNLA